MNRFLLLLLLIVCGYSLHAQREAANWYFGSNSGFDFNSGNPIPINDSSISTIESSSVISDNSGNLLFYTDGEEIFNREFDLMSNGDEIAGHKSSTSGALIIPDPGDTNNYYVFTADAVQNYQDDGGMPLGNGLNYSVVNMTADGGLGVVSQKNINLISESSEKLTAVAREDGLGFWVLTHSIDTFYAFSITASGISPPITTLIGPAINDYNNIRGWIKFSPDGSKVGVAHSLFEPSLNGSLILYDFDSNTGIVSNERFLGDNLVFYGVEFSSNSERLYATAKVRVSGGLNTGNIQIFQYDLIVADIAGSRFLIREIESDALSDVAGALQLGIDCKIYYTNADSEMSVIARPNRNDVAADFRFGAVNLGTGSGSLGLPGCIQSYFDNIIEYDNLCEQDTTTFTLNTSRSITSVIWDFGDASSPDNTSVLLNPLHQYTSAGTFLVTVTVTFVDGTIQTYKKILQIVEPPELQGTLLRQCDTDGSEDGLSLFNLEESISTILNNIVSETAQVTFFESEVDALNNQNVISNTISYPNVTNGQVVYARVDVTFDCLRIVEVTLQVQANSIPPDRERDICSIVGSQADVELILDDILQELSVIYPNLSIKFYTSLEDAVAELQDLDINPVSSLDGIPELYYRVENTTGCLAIGLYILNLIEGPTVSNIDIVLCDPESGLELSLEETFISYEWETGATSSSIIVNEPGSYTVTVYNSAGCFDIASFIVTEAPSFNIDVIVNDFQQNNEVQINIDTAVDEVFYSLDGGASFQTNSSFRNLIPGYYNLVVIDGDNCNRIEQLVEVRGAPRFFTPNGDGIHDYWQVLDASNYPGMTITVMDRFGKQLTNFTNTSLGWDGTYSGEEMPTNAYWYKIEYDNNTYYGHFTLIRRR